MVTAQEMRTYTNECYQKGPEYEEALRSAELTMRLAASYGLRQCIVSTHYPIRSHFESLGFTVELKKQAIYPECSDYLITW